MEHFRDYSIDQLLREGGFDCDCGRHHDVMLKRLVVGQGALFRVSGVLADMGVKRPLLVCDANTYRVAGKQVFDLLKSKGFDAAMYLFPGEERLTPDEFNVGRVVMNFVPGSDCIVAVGSGVINDICKIVSKATGLRQVTVATAPSMDGYASNSSSMIVEGVKTTVYSVCPEAVIADVDVLRNAPFKMLQSGLGDMLAKYVSLCEWKITKIVNDEYYCEEIAALMRNSVKRLVEAAPKLARRDPEAVTQVIEGLVLSGIAMSFAKVSRPASGLEHYFSHIWDMHALMGRCPEDTHGIQCGVGTVLTIRMYNWLRQMKPDKEKALANAAAFDQAKWEADMREGFGPTAETVIAIEKKFGKHNAEKHKARIARICDRWDEITAAMDEELPELESLTSLMCSLQEPTMPRQIGLSDAEVISAFRLSMEIRDKYILSTLLWDMGLMDEFADKLLASLAV